MIVKTVVLRCDRERAFALFTERAGEWWPADRRHSDDEASTIRIEPQRFFERPREGPDIELGVVRRFEPVEDGTLVTVTHDAGAAALDVYGRNAPRYDRSWDAVLSALEVAARR
jgi:hypothetical protein